MRRTTMAADIFVCPCGGWTCTTIAAEGTMASACHQVRSLHAVRDVKVPALWGAAPRVVPCAGTCSSRSSCGSSCSSCTSVPARSAPKVSTSQVPRPLYTVDLSEVEEATLAAMTCPVNGSEHAKHPYRPRQDQLKQDKPAVWEAQVEELQRENSRLFQLLQERDAQQKKLERDARMQGIMIWANRAEGKQQKQFIVRLRGA
eukprot:g23832.t1